MTQEQQFFSIQHDFMVSCEPCEIQGQLPTKEQFQQMIPEQFRLASHINQIEAQALRPLRNLGESAHDLAEFLNLQSKKIDLMMNYILSLGSENQQLLPGTSFGGSQLNFVVPQQWPMDQLTKTKIFIEENNCVIFCISQVTQCKMVDGKHVVTAQIVMIEDEDQEQLVRTSLHVQSNQLKERAARRNDQTNSLDG